MSVTGRTTFQLFWQERTIRKEFGAGVSLHSHTMYSEESLEMVPRYTAKVPYLGAAISQQQAAYTKRTGCPFDFGRAFWTPPLTPRQAYRLEEKQINRRFGLPGIISITDHDDARAGALLRVMDRFRHAPISTEWTIPFGSTFFHLGIHNLPDAAVGTIMKELTRFTAEADPDMLGPVLETLNSYRNALLVLNHPLWDEKGIGVSNHAQMLRQLLERYGRHLHALEVNGLRSWNENKQVLELGRATGLPVVAGGDRHGREPNAILNLARGSTLLDFLHEVRYERVSHVVFMPQYHEPLKVRIVQTMVDIVRDYPESAEGRRTWSDRVFYRDSGTGAVVPLKTIWRDGGPAIVQHFITALRLLEWRGIRSALRFALDDRASAWSDRQAAG